ncbi:helix-turn-helix domain-containing protein [Tardiphaga robiniae]|uniref:ATP-binding protein n=1 Tax=Tardiphaga robiniae TaxID=943830 RepID=A0A7G6TVN5_9BRAD|nr:ATP-binding protein [Tardiphaga robiniae]QND70817.1 ATP-binding protein [Tardiphaga robiniae]
MTDDFPTYRTRADLEKLLADGAVEGTSLEFKDSRALSKEDRNVADLCANVSALANSNGGQIIFGINENKKTKGPVVVDDGVEDPTVTREWIGQILNSRIHPRMSRYTIDQIDMGNGKFGFCISVPQSQTGPHQAPDKKYYKRFELEVRPMEDYEIRDVLNRATHPDLWVDFAFKSGDRAELEFDIRQDVSSPVRIFGTIKNRSAQPSFHTFFRLGVSASLGFNTVKPPWTMHRTQETTKYGKIQWTTQRTSSPPDFPIFKEVDQPLDGHGVTLQFHSRTMAQAHRWPLLIEIHSPGFSSLEAWYIDQQSTSLRLLQPGHPLLR